MDHKTVDTNQTIRDKGILEDNSFNVEQQRKITEAIIEKFASMDYEYIGTIEVSSGNLHTIYDHMYNKNIPENGCYETVLDKLITMFFYEKDWNQVRKDLSIRSIVNNLNTHQQYTCYYNVKPILSSSCSKKLQFTYLNKDQNIIAFTRSDVTNIYNSELDELSGVFNRSAFYRHSKIAFDSNKDIIYAILVIDIDHFKVYNELFGVDEGDRLISDIGKIINKYMTRGFVGGRLEADRFAAILPANLVEKYDLINHMTKWFKGYRSDYELVPRFGLYKVTDATMDIGIMCDRALLAMQSTKGNHDKYVAWYDDSMRYKLLENQRIERDIINALERDEFQIFLQPQYDVVDGTLIGAEALARWFKPGDGMISPAVFIPVMEQTGMVTQLDIAVFEKVCRLLDSWKSRGIELMPISSNLSHRDIYNPKLCKTLCDISNRYKIDRKYLRLEITETAYMGNPEQLINTIKLLRSEGFLIEMDDFGSGYSSLNALKKMPIDIIKLDLQFLSDSEDGRSGIILNSVVQMAHWLNLRVIAEGVETARQADYLKTIGCRYVQGYFYGRPMPIDQYEGIMKGTLRNSSTSDITISKFFDSKEFWNPDALSTVIFNTFVGAAGIFEYDGETLIAIRVNDKFYEETGMDKEAISKHHNVWSVIPEEDKGMLKNVMEELKGSDAEKSFELRWRSISSGFMWLQMRVRCIASTTNISAYYVAVENITVKKILALKNKNLSEELAAIIKSTPGGVAKIVTSTYKPQIVYISEGLRKMFGLPMSYSLVDFHDHVLSKIHHDDYDRVYNEIMNKMKYGRSCEFQCRILKHDSNKYFWVDFKANPVNETGIGLVYYALFTDITSLKSIETELYYEKEKLDFAVSNSKISVWNYNILEGSCTIVNHSKDKFSIGDKIVTGMPERFIDKGYVYPDSVDDYIKLYDDIKAGVEVTEKIIHGKMTGDKEVWLKITYHTTFENDKPTGAIGYSVDVTDSVIKEQGYISELSFLEDVHNDSLIDKCCIDITNGKVEIYSANVENNLSLDDVDVKDMDYDFIVDKILDDCFCMEQRLELSKLLDRSYLESRYHNQEMHVDYEYQRIIKKGSSPIWVKISINIYQYPFTDDIKVFMYCYDINDEMLIHKVMDSIYNNGFSAIGILDIPTKTLRLYQRSVLEEDVGIGMEMPYEEGLNLIIDKYVIEESKDDARQALSIETIVDALDRENNYNCSFSIRYNDKPMRKKWECSYLKDDKNKIVYTRSNITELFLKQEEQQRQLNEALGKAKKASAAKSDFLSNMSHDIRTPMNAIINMTRITREDFAKGKDITVDLDKISISSDFLLGLINDILDMSRIESGKLELIPDVYSYAEFLDYIRSIIESLCAEKNISFNMNEGITDLPIYVDKIRFNQLFFNVLSNAIKYTEPGGRIEYNIFNNKIHDGILSCDFVISDTGCGMSEEFQKKMYLPFERESDNNEAYTGTGLGLSIVKSIVDLMKGTISVKSELGVGTEITIHLDMQLATREQIEESQSRIVVSKQLINLSGRKILAVEDNELNMEIMQYLLESEGLVVDTAFNGKEAIEKFNNNNYDAILMDIRMPIMDGLEATKAIRASAKPDAANIPIIAMTANAFDVDRQISMESGMTDYLTKPVVPEDLYHVLRKCISIYKK